MTKKIPHSVTPVSQPSLKTAETVTELRYEGPRLREENVQADISDSDSLTSYEEEIDRRWSPGSMRSELSEHWDLERHVWCDADILSPVDQRRGVSRGRGSSASREPRRRRVSSSWSSSSLSSQMREAEREMGSERGEEDVNSDDSTSQSFVVETLDDSSGSLQVGADDRDDEEDVRPELLKWNGHNARACLQHRFDKPQHCRQAPSDKQRPVGDPDPKRQQAQRMEQQEVSNSNEGLPFRNDADRLPRPIPDPKQDFEYSPALISEREEQYWQGWKRRLESGDYDMQLKLIGQPKEEFIARCDRLSKETLDSLLRSSCCCR